jgi:hypothetical protein
MAIGALVVAFASTADVSSAQADNKRLNESVYANIYTVQHQAGCQSDPKRSVQLDQAARVQALDVRDNRGLEGDIGSGGSTPQQRAGSAGFKGTVAETVAINPAFAISGIELMNQWFSRPDYLAIMRDCRNSAIGVWSENSLDRTVVVAVYGQPV